MSAVLDTPATTHAVTAPVGYVLHLADNAAVLGQRNAEWCGHGPILEEDLALANMSLDLIGQARLLYSHAASLMGTDSAAALAARNGGRLDEDTLAYFRDVPEFCNYTLLELPHHAALVGYAKADMDYATTIARNFLYSALMVPLWTQLQTCSDEVLASIAAKSLKEARYHLRHSRDWLVRLGDGTVESTARMQAALAHLMPYTQEFWTQCALESEASAAGIAVDWDQLQADWNALVDDALSEADLARPASSGYITQGKNGSHSEHLGFLLSEMQGLARAHPGAQW
ncbi:MAG: 1,2-phenylacetyl-CoA epoxidase subunit PaaC [Hydrogenophaga sp.]|uniref:1,2-phenylacetyl-CoA epoxidase subunit PaaC n=1 Tax=Hydrogenophaga sp. TaxID=1904254 RepID=UPI002758D199|nr:1,2-phenylacetyl-CoA epoxidase subunit PaaC [Hydrogenophaga sp.]MDP3423723.1 1,2-phenylacetyl-CoA epoxidase subunit PaaC [Burkholderiaceae bacterium]MDZ4190123.1 1,2-phenylacetyl-CoA epoxidase subunit PaaC [Hydrogenophaga sp.]